MNNIQLYLSIGIPSLLVVLNIIQAQRLNDKVDRLGERLNDRMDKLGDALRGEMNQLGNAMRGEMVTFRREVHGDLMMLHERVVKVETRQDI
jgi:hypothetical protein